MGIKKSPNKASSALQFLIIFFFQIFLTWIKPFH